VGKADKEHRILQSLACNFSGATQEAKGGHWDIREQSMYGIWQIRGVGV